MIAESKPKDCKLAKVEVYIEGDAKFSRRTMKLKQRFKNCLVLRSAVCCYLRPGALDAANDYDE